MSKTKLFTGFLIAVPLVAFALTGASATPILADVAFATYGQEKVKLCYNGSDISVNPEDVQFYLNDGATRGKCKPRPGNFTLLQPIVTCSNRLPRVALDWTTAANATTYSVQRILGNTTFPVNYNKNKAIQSGIVATDYIDNNFMPDYGRIDFTYRVGAFKNGQPTYSNTVTFKMPECNPRTPTRGDDRDGRGDDRGGRGNRS
jgi:hypothetical protein